MAILITGGAGFIGSHLIERLLAHSSDDLISIDNFNDYYDPALKRANAARFMDEPRVTQIEADFCDVAAVEELFTTHQIDSVVHLGAYAGVRVSVAEPHVYQQTNVGGTLNLLEAVRRHPVKRFLLASSSTVYGRGAAIPFQEDAHHGVPASPYGATKRAAELLGLCYAELHDTPVVCLRPFSVYGPRLRPDLALTIFAKAIHTGATIPLFGDGSIRRDFTHVSDICDGLISALSAENVIGETINLGHSDPIEMRGLIALLEEAFGKKANIQKLPKRPEDLPVTFANLDKAKRLLNYHPQVPIEAGIREYVEWFKSWYD
ncbi:NAD-dependent epimerase/dehydratase family protein [Blastopirellula retiformator]|uniref:UDP-glucose 4-epimerase n=1 Tax=Blastopirellula retiformator TaxID=2527970 RepID=A0A5C5UZ54_9BACT|nr:NAD-dependent epimerase/dehydratase family protein [Blastopirellula retiformator]TWT30772.1 UDP-glucose 4-epimerase [Blastopirellula retiformator]